MAKNLKNHGFSLKNEGGVPQKNGFFEKIRFFLAKRKVLVTSQVLGLHFGKKISKNELWKNSLGLFKTEKKKTTKTAK